MGKSLSYEYDLQVFRRIACERDFQLVTGAAEIRYSDFYRLDFILVSLELDSLELAFSQRYADRFRGRLERHIDIDCGDWDAIRSWCDEFMANICSQEDREWVAAKFFGGGTTGAVM